MPKKRRSVKLSNGLEEPSQTTRILEFTVNPQLVCEALAGVLHTLGLIKPGEDIEDINFQLVEENILVWAKVKKGGGVKNST